MAQKKAHEVAGWLRRPDPAVCIVLIYGPDRGLVSERASEFAAKTGLALDDPFSVVRLDAGEADSSGRLAEEARTVSMFGGKRLLWVRDVGAHKALSDDVKALCADPPVDTAVLLEAGELKKGMGIRAIVEGAAVGMALPCYADEARDLDQLIDDIMGSENIRLLPEARAELRRNLGGDRLATRAELQKLALYARDKGELTSDDVRLLSGDVSDLSVDDAIDAVLEGRLRDFDTIFQRYAQAGGQTFPLINGMSRQLQALELLRSTMDAGKRSPADIVAAAKPAIFFSRRKVVETALRRLSGPFIRKALARLHATVLESRKRADLATALTRQALLAIAVESARQSGSR